MILNEDNLFLPEIHKVKYFPFSRLFSIELISTLRKANLPQK